MPIITFSHKFYCPLCGNQIIVSGSMLGYMPLFPRIIGGDLFESIHVKCKKCNAKGAYNPRKEEIIFKK